MRHTNLLDWHQDTIQWHTYEGGFVASQNQNKPLMLAFYTHWCPDCHNIAHYFYHPDVVAMSEHFIMTWANRDEQPDVGHAHDVDGTYVPRLQFFDAAGDLQHHLQSGREDDVYFYEAQHLDQMIDNMRAMLNPIAP